MAQDKSYINGADYFQLYLDRENKKQSADASTVRLLFVFESKVDLNLLKQQLANAEILSEINGLKLKSEPLNNYYYWDKSARKSSNISIKSWSGNIADLQPFEHLDTGEYLRINLLKGIKRDAILFHLHHIISDNKGFQDLISLLNTQKNISISDSPKLGKCASAISFFEKTWKVLKPKKGTMLSFATKEKHRAFKFHILSKNIEDIDAINQVLAGRVLPGSSTVLLNHIAAIMEKYKVSEKKNAYFWVPVPADRRKKKVEKSFSLGNQLSILFYKIETGLSDAKRIESLQNQMIEQVKNKRVVDYELLNNTMTKFPYPLYKAMLELPDRAKFCSFTYSDLGHTFKEMDSFLGHKIVDVINFPSVPLKPGIVFVTMRYAQKFHLVLGVDDNIIQEQEAAKILEELENRFTKCI